MEFWKDCMPFHLVAPEDGRKVLASAAILGLQCMERGFLLDDPENKATTSSWTLDEWQKWYRELVRGQIEFIADHCGNGGGGVGSAVQ
jgi:hypothetical protein